MGSASDQPRVGAGVAEGDEIVGELREALGPLAQQRVVVGPGVLRGGERADDFVGVGIVGQGPRKE